MLLENCDVEPNWTVLCKQRLAGKKTAPKPSLTTKNRQHFSENCSTILATSCEMFTVGDERAEQERTAKLLKETKTRLGALKTAPPSTPLSTA